MAELTELGLQKRLGSDPASVAEIHPDLATSHEPVSESLAVLVQRLLEIIGQFAPETESGDLEGFRDQLQQYRKQLDAPSADVARITEACIEACRRYFERSRNYRTEREKELLEVIGILRDAAQLSVGQSEEFNAQVLASSERFTAIAQLEDIRDLRKRLDDEVGTLRRAVAEKQAQDEVAYAQLKSRVKTLQRQIEHMELEAMIDPLTRVGNRRRFQLSLTRMMHAARQAGNPLALAMLDIDHFKQVNDTHGHPIGDAVLLRVAQALSKTVRQSDVVARYGGEEFALLMENASVSDLEARMNRLLADVAATAYEYELLGRKQRVTVTLSCGLTELAANDTEEDLVKRADQALYEAKHRGRNRLVSRKRSIIGRVLAWN